MPSRQVTIQGVLTWDDAGVAPPLFPTHPIAPGGTTPPWGIPLPPIAGQGPGFPTHPIAPGGTTPPWGIPLPPGIWPSPGHPAHPIAPGGPPPGTWGGSGQPFPTPPIFLPPDQPEGGLGIVMPPVAAPPGTNWAWVPYYGWVLVPESQPGPEPKT